jgi:Uma2 family endonuclease
MQYRQNDGSAMEQPRQTGFTADEFIAWAAEQPTGRYELADGVVVAMAPERVNHTRAKFDAAIALRAAIKARGPACEALPDGTSVRIDQRTVYEPDVLVRCGPRAPGDAIEVTDPMIVVEVVSPSSRGVDTGAKLAGYFKLPSVRHYLVVNTESRVVIHHRRDEEGAIGVRVLHDGLLTLDPPGLEIEIRDIFSSL